MLITDHPLRKTVMNINEFDYRLPKELIAQNPLEERSSSRLLVLHRREGQIEHRHFYGITHYLREGDLVVVNSTKVLPVKLTGTKQTGGRFDLLLVDRLNGVRWSCLVSGLKAHSDEVDVRVGDVPARLMRTDGAWTIAFPSEDIFRDVLNRYGRMPLPPYVKRGKEGSVIDFERYQTVYAEEPGAIAAPTAGLHFSPELLSDLASAGVQVAKIILHIGLGTFLPVKVQQVQDHEMHAEPYIIPAQTAEAIAGTRERRGRIIAVGTSVVRALESAYGTGTKSMTGRTDLFIYPGYTFRVVDGLVTNFHTPKSTPLLLVSAFAGIEAVRNAYGQAIEQGYRFFSYGDAMFII